MASLDTLGITKLASVLVDMKTAGATTLYAVPAGKTLFVTHVVVRDPTLSMAGGTSYSFTGWKQTVDLSSLTAGTDYIVLDSNNAKYTESAAFSNFQITVVTGATLLASATVEVFGYLV